MDAQTGISVGTQSLHKKKPECQCSEMQAPVKQ